MRRVAVDFAFNPLLKDKVSPEARQWEKRRDEKEIAKQMARLVATTKLFASFAIREKIKDKSIDEAEAFLKEVAKDIEHIELYTPPNGACVCAAVAFHNTELSMCVCAAGT